MTTSHWIRTSPQTDLSTDILIVGGGYVGLSTAYWLTEYAPHLNIVVLERSFSGAGASGRNAGFLTMGSASFYKFLTSKWSEEKAKSIYQFARESLQLVHEHILLKHSEVQYVKSSSMTLFQNEDQWSKWKENNFSPEKFDFIWRKQSELPKKLQERFFGAFENGPEYKVVPTTLLKALTNTLSKRKVKILEGSSAYEITPEGVKTEVNTIKAKKVILAMNAYLGQFHPTFKSSIVPRRAQMLAVKLEEEFDCPSLYYDSPHRVYWRKTDENVLIIGGKRLLDEEGETGDFEKLSPIIQKSLEEYVNEQLRVKYKVLNRWSGTMGFTDHELPYVSEVKAPLETYMIGGFSGHGMGLGFRSGKDMAEVLLKKRPSFFDQFKKADFSL